MVAAVHFFATAPDETALLDHLGEPGAVSLHPWPVVDPGSPPLSRTEVAHHRKLTVHNPALGDLVLALWDRGLAAEGVLSCSSLGSQADAMEAISDDYASWARRVMAWIRRKGTKVWGLEASSLRPDLDIELHHVSAVYALPGALLELENGGRGR